MDLTLQEFGEKFGKDKQYVWAIENGRKNISIDLLHKIIEAHGAHHRDFFNNSFE